MQCIRCKKDFEQKEEHIKRKIDAGYDYHICSGCFRSLNIRYKDKLTNDALYFGPKENPFPWDIFQKNKDALKGCTKLYVKGICVECNNEFIRRVDKIVHSEYMNDIPICQKCVLHYVTNTEKWRKKNSEAQFIAQNKEETKQKMYKTMEKRKEKDELFALKRSFGREKFLKGFYKNFYFASSYELSFLYENKDKNIKQCIEKINYISNDGKEKTYTPDFQIDNTLIEVKGRIDEFKKSNKYKYAIKFFQNSNFEFKIITKDDINIFFINNDDLKIFTVDELILTSLPKTFNKKNNMFWWENHFFTKQLQKYFENVVTRKDAEKLIDFYAKERNFNIYKKFDNTFWKWYDKEIHSIEFLMFYILIKGMKI